MQQTSVYEVACAAVQAMEYKVIVHLLRSVLFIAMVKDDHRVKSYFHQRIRVLVAMKRNDISSIGLSIGTIGYHIVNTYVSRSLS